MCVLFGLWFFLVKETCFNRIGKYIWRFQTITIRLRLKGSLSMLSIVIMLMCSVQRSLGCLYFLYFSIVCSMTPKKWLKGARRMAHPGQKARVRSGSVPFWGTELGSGRSTTVGVIPASGACVLYACPFVLLPGRMFCMCFCVRCGVWFVQVDGVGPA